jgi:hypothetical protein
MARADERRLFPRRRVLTPIGIDTEERKGRGGMTRDMSVGGVLFYTASRFKVGEEVEVSFRVAGKEEITVRGVVVRVGRDPGSETVFNRVAAVRFHEPLAKQCLAA